MKINCLIIRYFSFPNNVEIFSHLLGDLLKSLEVLVWVYKARILKINIRTSDGALEYQYRTENYDRTCCIEDIGNEVSFYILI